MKTGSNSQITAALVLLFSSSCMGQVVEQRVETLVVDGVTREYTVLLPAGYSETELPVLFNLHGSGGTSAGQLAASDLASVAGENGFIGVLPQGVYTNSRSGNSWNADLDNEGVDDVLFVVAMIDALENEIDVDESRIYVTGFSGGARMTSRLACELSDTLAAVAPVAGIQFGDGCESASPLPVLAFHSTDDQVNHYFSTEASAPYWSQDVEISLWRWRNQNGCTDRAGQTPISASITYYEWDDCAAGTYVGFYQLNDGGHTWPGSPRRNANQEIQASQLIWDFVSRYSRMAP